MTALSWADQGACRGLPASVFFIERGQSAEPAKAVCRSCPVLDECADWGLRHEETGIWGGMSAQRRERLRKELHITCKTPDADWMRQTEVGAVPRQCGTNAGYQRHRRLGEEACTPCKIAHMELTEKWKEREKRLREESA